MSTLTPKNRTIFCCILCIIGAIICKLVGNISINFVIDLLILALSFFIMFFVLKNIDIRIADILFYVLTLLVIFVIGIISNLPIMFNLIAKDWEKQIRPIVLKECTNECHVEGRYIYNSKKQKIYKWHGWEYVYEGNISSNGQDISYIISFEKKCIKKEFNKNFTVEQNKCK